MLTMRDECRYYSCCPEFGLASKHMPEITQNAVFKLLRG
jgi:hypothetical protein